MALKPIHLRLETSDGGVEEYRVHDEYIETRRWSLKYGDDGWWRRVTPEELTRHVNGKTAVSEWLEQRLGWRRLLWACLAEQDRFLFETNSQNTERRAA